MIAELAGQNYRAAKDARLYFNELADKIQDFIGYFVSQQAEYEKLMDPSDLVCFEDRKQFVDSCGSAATEFRSSIATVRIYCNQPVGWVFGDVRQHVPSTSHKRFAINPKPNSYTDLAPKVFGCYSFGADFPTPYRVAKQIILELAQGDLQEEHLAIRPSQSEGSPVE